MSEQIDYALVLDIINTDGAPTAALASFIAQEVEAARAEVVAQVVTILDGIDRQQTDKPEGWWETSFGAQMGREILDEIRALSGTADRQDT